MSKTDAGTAETAVKKKLPLPLVLAFPLFIAGGVLLGFTRTSRTEAALYSAIDNCDAAILSEKNGLSDAFGVVHFRAHQNQVAAYLSLCELDPPSALRVFRQAFEKGGKSAKLVAMHSAFFLSSGKHLQKEDFLKILSFLDPEKEKNIELRRAAQRVISDLTAIDAVESAGKYESIPASAKSSPTDEVANKIATQKQTLRGKEVLAVRWSNPDLAHAWWQAHADKGSWNQEWQRFVFPGDAKK